jgi:hypothetical protein
LKHEPSRLPLINKLMKKFEGKEQELLDRLNRRYSKPKVEQPSTKVVASTVLTEGEATPPTTLNKRTQSAVAAEKAKALTRDAMTESATKTVEVRDFANLSGKAPLPSSPPGTPQIHGDTKLSPPPSSPVTASDKATEESAEKGTKEENQQDVDKGEKVDMTAKMARGNMKAEKFKKRAEKKVKELHAKISKLVSFVYGNVSDSEHKARMKTILRAYKDREFVLLKLLETKAEVKIDNDKNSSEVKVGIPKTISYVSDAEDAADVESIGSAKSGKSNRSTKSGKSNSSRKSGRKSRSRSRSNGATNRDELSVSRSGRKGPPRARKGITKSSNGDDDTISTLSQGTAKFARRRQDAKVALTNSSSSKEVGSSKEDNNNGSSGSSAKENAKESRKVKKRSGSWLFGKKRDKGAKAQPKLGLTPVSPQKQAQTRGSPVHSADNKGRVLSQKSPGGNEGTTTSTSKPSKKEAGGEERKKSLSRGSHGFLQTLDMTMTSEI